MTSVLFITAFPPNEKTAGQNYTRLLLDDLIRHGYKTDLVYFNFPGHGPAVNSRVRILKAFDASIKNILANPPVFPLFSKRFDRTALVYLNSIADKYDILYFDFSQVHLYSKYISHPHKILMCHDVIYQKTKRQTPLLLWWEKLTEKSALKSAQTILTFSKKDCALIRKVYALDSVPVNFYLKNARPKCLPETEKDTFCFYGAWNRRENYETLSWFIKNVLPKVQRNFKYKIIGGGLPRKIHKKIAADSRFEHTGFVEDPVTEIAKCQALIAPLLHGAGVKVKVIDAITSGTKVIGTGIAFEGISDNPGAKLFYECATAKEFAAVLNGWKPDSAGHKLFAAGEFFSRYDTNHLPDLLDKIKKSTAPR